ncbi:MAG: hypothetical protein ACYDHH_12385 [Solirubrobacteraceae bacterium]
MSRSEAKIGAIGGIAYGVLSLVAWQLWACPSFPHLPHFPPLSSSATTWAHWYVQHQNVKRLAGSLWALSVLPMVFFLSTLYTALREAEGERGYWSRIMLVGGILTEVAVVMFSLALLIAAYHPGKVSPDITYTMNDIFIVCAVPLGVGFLLMTSAIAVIVLRYGGLPRWVGYAALVVGVFQLGFQGSAWTDRGIFDGSGGFLGLYLPYGSSLIWFISMGVAIVRMSNRQEAALRAETPLAVPGTPSLAGR